MGEIFVFKIKYIEIDICIGGFGVRVVLVYDVCGVIGVDFYVFDIFDWVFIYLGYCYVVFVGRLLVIGVVV